MPLQIDSQAKELLVWHPTIGKYVPLVAIAPTLQALKMALKQEQEQILQDILAQSVKLSDLAPLLVRAGEIKVLLESSGTGAVIDRLDGSILSALGGISSNTDGLAVLLVAIRDLESAANQLLTSIEGKVGNYDSALAAIAANQGVQISHDFVSVPRVASLNLSVANTEYPYTLPQNTKQYSFKCRAGTNDEIAPFRYGFVSGIVATETDVGGESYYTVEGSQEDTSPRLKLSEEKIIYFAASQPLVISIKIWS